MTYKEIIETIEEAQELIIQAQQMVDQAISGTQLENHYEAYGKYGFNTLLGNGNPHDSSLYTLLEAIEDEENYDDDLDNEFAPHSHNF